MAEVTTSRNESAAAQDIESRLARIWASMLCIDAVKPTDSFFEVGGDSMMIMVMLSRVREEFGVEVSQDVVFHSPTLHEFTLMIRDAVPLDTESQLEAGIL